MCAKEVLLVSKSRFNEMVMTFSLRVRAPDKGTYERLFFSDEHFARGPCSLPYTERKGKHSGTASGVEKEENVRATEK